MNVKDVIISRNHLSSPFTIPSKDTELSTKDKVAAIAFAILIGTCTAIIGGVIAFYFITAAIKVKKLNHPQLPPKFEEPPPNPSSSYPTSIQERKFPPLSLCDTMIILDGNLQSCRPDGKFYQDEEILVLHPSIQEIDLGDGIKANLTEGNKVVIQQQAKRGCTAAAAAMLIYDTQKPINLYALCNTNLGDSESIERLMTEAGLTSLITKLEDNNLTALQKLIHQHGPAIVTTSNDIGAHVVVVDAVNNDSIRLRDPCHGWAITVTEKAFLRGFCGGDIIQVA